MRQLDEAKDKDIIEAWEKEAKEQTLETLPAFLKKLTEEYAHDYGTICKAMATAAVATCWAVNNHPQGGVTGFQAGAVMWEFMRMWNGVMFPARLIQYENLLYPQYCDGRFGQISHETWEFLQKEAKRLLEEVKDDTLISKKVLEHWEALSAGRNVTGMEIEVKEETVS